MLQSSTKEIIKEQLKKLSSIVQYLSFETMEQMLYKMKTLNIKKLQTEFLMLTLHHAQEFHNKVDLMPLELETKE